MNIKDENKSSGLDIVFAIIKFICWTFIIVFGVIGIFLKLIDNSTNIFGYHIHKVSDNLMSPDIKKNQVLLVQKTDSSMILSGDNITYLNDDSKIVVSNVVEIIDPFEGDTSSFVVKDNKNDEVVISEDQVYGKVIMILSIISLVSMLSSNVILFVISLAVPIGILIVLSLTKILTAKRKKDLEKKIEDNLEKDLSEEDDDEDDEESQKFINKYYE